MSAPTFFCVCALPMSEQQASSNTGKVIFIIMMMCLFIYVRGLNLFEVCSCSRFVLFRCLLLFEVCSCSRFVFVLFSTKVCTFLLMIAIGRQQYLLMGQIFFIFQQNSAFRNIPHYPLFDTTFLDKHVFLPSVFALYRQTHSF